jgi:hypothetical protein
VAKCLEPLVCLELCSHPCVLCDLRDSHPLWAKLQGSFLLLSPLKDRADEKVLSLRLNLKRGISLTITIIGTLIFTVEISK